MRIFFFPTFFVLIFPAPFSKAQEKLFSTDHYNVLVETRFSGLEYPWALDFLPDGRLLITEKSGNLLLVNLADQTSLKVKNVPEVHYSGQGGLLDVLVDAKNKDRPTVYLSFSQREGSRSRTAVARGTLNGDRLENVRILFKGAKPVSGTRHYGSRLKLSRAGHLYISHGDRANARNVQRLDNHFGKILRILPGGGVPKDNPSFTGQKGLPEIFTTGHRNPQGMALHPDTGEIWISEHGAKGGDEINRIEAGKNYGWPVISYGTHYSGSKIGIGTEKEGMEQPVHYWDPSIAPSGMTFYTGGMFPKWDRNLFVTSLKFGLLSRLEIKNNQVVSEERIFQGGFGRIRDIKQSPEGTLLFLTDSSQGRLLEIRLAEK